MFTSKVPLEHTQIDLPDIILSLITYKWLIITCVVCLSKVLSLPISQMTSHWGCLESYWHLHYWLPVIDDTLTFSLLPAMAFKARVVFAFIVFLHLACFRVCSKVMMTSNDTEDMSHLFEFYGDIKNCIGMLVGHLQYLQNIYCRLKKIKW